MAWTELTRRQHARVGDKYASDLTDAEWALIEPLMPPRKTNGPKFDSKTDKRLISFRPNGQKCYNTSAVRRVLAG